MKSLFQVYLGIFTFIMQLFRHRIFKYTKHGNLKNVGINIRINIEIKHDSLSTLRHKRTKTKQKVIMHISRT